MWKVCVPENERFMNVEKVFPTQQKDVSKIVEKLSNNIIVQKIIIFGSSVTSACNPWSDIDIYLELREEQQVRAPKVFAPLDIWTNYDVDGRLLSDIKEKGVVVFERGNFA